MTLTSIILVCTLHGVGMGLFNFREPGGHTERYIVESIQHCDDVARQRRTSGKHVAIVRPSEGRMLEILCGPNAKDCPVAKR